MSRIPDSLRHFVLIFIAIMMGGTKFALMLAEPKRLCRFQPTPCLPPALAGGHQAPEMLSAGLSRLPWGFNQSLLDIGAYASVETGAAETGATQRR